MLGKLFSTTLSVLILTGCAINGTENKSSSVDSQKILRGSIYGKLVQNGDGFYIKDQFYSSSPQARKSIINSDRKTNEWIFDAATFYPGFETKQFTCEESACEALEELANPFIGLSFASAMRGDTFEEMTKRKGLSYEQYDPFKDQNNLSEYAKDATAGVFVAAISPWLLVAGVADLADDGDSFLTKRINKNVYFDHVAFTNEIREQVKLKFGSFATYKKVISQIVIADNKNQKYLENLNKELNFKSYKLDNLRTSSKSSRTHYLREIAPYSINLPSSLEDLDNYFTSQISDYYEQEKLRITSEYDKYYDLLAADSINYYSKASFNSVDEIENARIKMKRLQKQEELLGLDTSTALLHVNRSEQILRFKRLKNTNSSLAWHSFIEKYSNSDYANLIASAKSKEKLALKFEVDRANKRKQAQELAQARRIAKLESLNKWRKTVKVGDNTFCGRVIEANSNQTMFKLALSVKLSGYSSEQWIHIDNIYQPWQGCKNVNGNLSPNS
ncbi:hypothetical protein [Thalassotalea sp. ND16A]|uniref:hypothetical protein n=1 Tax=Thalassotalea sp. ND16A TaxID=1535422 RepID=UPI00051A69F4|nr:hypothetical protein [Thalassotalea sp. ND16A]KGK00365.1 hypothetical protein ND16A_3572 [Thalassotalea sp. ND16A]